MVRVSALLPDACGGNRSDRPSARCTWRRGRVLRRSRAKTGPRSRWTAASLAAGHTRWRHPQWWGPWVRWLWRRCGGCGRRRQWWHWPRAQRQSTFWFLLFDETQLPVFETQFGSFQTQFGSFRTQFGSFMHAIMTKSDGGETQFGSY